jgi:hypothetical protein
VELRATIHARYPDAQFRSIRAEDDRHSWHLWTMVNGEELDEVGNLVIDRQVEMLAEEHIPIHVIPTRSSAQQGSYARANVKRTG